METLERPTTRPVARWLQEGAAVEDWAARNFWVGFYKVRPHSLSYTLRKSDSYFSELIEPVLPRVAQLVFLTLTSFSWRCIPFEGPDLGHHTIDNDGKLEREGEEKSQQPAGFEPLTSWWRGKCSTAALQPRKMQQLLTQKCYNEYSAPFYS